MPDPQGRLRYGGVWCDGAFSVPRTASCHPDTIVADFVLSASLPTVADMEIWYGDQYIVLPNCRLVRRDIQSSSSGRMWRCAFQDRRWLWQYSRAMGDFAYHLNLTDVATGVGRSTFNAQRLIDVIKALFLQAGDDPLFGLASAWSPLSYYAGHFDFVPFGLAIERILQAHNLVACLGWDNRVRIMEENIGSPPPDDPRVMEYVFSELPPTVPQFLAMHSSHTRFLTDFPLLAVGYQADFKGNVDFNHLVPIEHLSYRPINLPWDPPYFFNVDQKFRKLCQDTIFKLYVCWYYNKTMYIQTPTVSGLPPRTKVWEWYNADDFVISPNIADAARINMSEPLDNVKSVRDPWPIWGHFVNNAFAMTNNDTVLAGDLSPHEQLRANYYMPYTGFDINQQWPKHQLRVGYEFYPESQLVKFDKAVWYNNSNPVVVPNEMAVIQAPIIMRAWHTLRRKLDGETMRQVSFVPFASPEVVNGLVEVHPVLSMYSSQAEDFFVSPRESECTKWKTWLERVSESARRVALKYSVSRSANVQYKGFAFDLNVSGQTKGVRFDRNEAGQCVTTVSWNQDSSLYFDNRALRNLDLTLKTSYGEILDQFCRNGGYNLVNLVQP